MEKATHLLNAASVVVLIVTGIYIQVVFSTVLSAIARVELGLVGLVCLLIHLGGWFNARRKEINELNNR